MEQSKSVKFLRYTEYYGMEEKLEDLYKRSLEGEIFYSLMDLILERENILLAYRTIKRSHGSYIRGNDQKTIEDIEILSIDELVEKVRFILTGSEHGYRPKPILRKEIPMKDGKTRPLGIPSIWDRLIEQCIKQILEPIAEAKFSNNSFGLRPDTSVEHALGSFYKLLNRQHCYFVVELNIESFFDNVDHSKLIRQLWTLGIRDKHLIFVLKRILKAPIKLMDGSIEMPKKGILSSGIISSLLANIVLNEFDQWIDSQWQNHPIANKYAINREDKGKGIDKGLSYRKMRKSRLKEIYLIRYGDNIRLFTKSYHEAKRILEASTQWLKERLTLSSEKNKIIDLRKEFSNFLGFKIRLREKAGKLVVESHISDRALKTEKIKLKNQIKNIVHPRKGKGVYDEVRFYNSMVLRVQEYYKYATDIQLDLDSINWDLMKALKNRTRTDGNSGRLKKTGRKLTTFEKKRFGKSKQIKYIVGTDHMEPIYPLSYIKTFSPRCKSRTVNRYTPQGRLSIHENLKMDLFIMQDLMEESSFGRSVEFMDNRLSLFSAQHGRCAISKEEFVNSKDIHCHHILPKSKGGRDDYQNLVLVKPEIHNLIHATDSQKISQYLKLFDLDSKQIEKLNKYRIACGNKEI